MDPKPVSDSRTTLARWMGIVDMREAELRRSNRLDEREQILGGRGPSSG